MAWHRCARYWKYGASCPVRGVPGHEEEEEEEDDEEEEDRTVPPVMLPERVRRPVEPGSIVAVAEAFVREVQTREVAVPAGDPVVQPKVPVSVPEWVPAVADLVVPTLYPTSVDVPSLPMQPRFHFDERNPFGDVSRPSSPTLAVAPDPTERVGLQILALITASAIGVGLAVVAKQPAVVSRIVAIAEGVIGGFTSGLPKLATEAGRIRTPTGGALMTTGAATIVRTIVSRTPDQIVDDVVRATIEEVVVDYMYPTAGERAVSISKALAAVTKQPVSKVGDAYVGTDPFDYSWQDPFVGPGPAPPGGHGYLFDFGSYLNSQTGYEGPLPGTAAADLSVY